MSFAECRKEVEKFLPKELAAIRKHFPYKMPKTHMDWETMTALIVSIGSQDNDGKADQATKLHSYLWYCWVNYRYPMYCISDEMLDMFVQQSAESVVKVIPNSWVPPVGMLLLNFPNGSVISPDDGDCPYVLIAIKHPELERIIEGEYDFQISLALIDSKGIIWNTGTGIENGKILHRKNKLGEIATSEAENEWLMKLWSIALQSLLTISFAPDLIEEEKEVKEGTGFAKPSKDKPRQMHPRWIGRDFVRPVASERPFKEGSKHRSHKSPVMHWRTAHERKQRYGKGLTEMRIIKIGPRLVNKDKI